MEKIALDFRRKVVFVTGASSGIGAVLAQMFAAHGAEVAICSRSHKNIEQRARQITGDFGSECLAITADMTEPSDVSRAFSEILKKFGRLDILVNNVGNSVRSSLEELSAERWKWGMALNLDSAAYCTMHAAELFIGQRSGVIINISSVAGTTGTLGEIPYSVSKAGLQMLTRLAAAEWGKYGIRVNCVAPGMTLTEKVKSSVDRGLYDMDELAAHFPLRRAGTTEEVGNAVLFLASNHASYITGQTLLVDGGPQIAGIVD